MELVLEMLEDISCERNDKRSTYLENLLEEIFELGNDDPSKIEKQYHCDISVTTEKHHMLQYTHYYTITSNLIKGELYLEIEDGINNGTLLRNYSFDKQIIPEKRYVEVLKDIEIDEDAYLGSRFSIEKAYAVFPVHKNKILELYRKQGYDNYVTGGGTNKTDNYYKSEFDKYHEMGLFWTCIYEETEVDLNLI